jgi:hypothetical protein
MDCVNCCEILNIVFVCIFLLIMFKLVSLAYRDPFEDERAKGLNLQTNIRKNAIIPKSNF